MVVGDSDQSVYRFRGADISNILDFEQAFPDATAITLDQNFRSTQTILDAANAVITNNVSRKPKTLWTDRGPGSRSSATGPRTSTTRPSGWPTRSSGSARDQGLRWGDVAVFYRTNAQSAALEEAMVRAEVPYKVVGGTKFYDRREVKDVMAYLRVLVNPDDEVSWRRIVNVPKRGVGETSVAKLAGWAGQPGVSFGEAVADADEAGIGGKAGTALVGPVGHCSTGCASADGRPAPGRRERRRHRPRGRDRPRRGEPGAGGAGPERPGRRRSGSRAPDAQPGDLAAAMVERTGYRSELLSRGDHRGPGPGGERRRPGGDGRRVPDPGRVPRGGRRWWPTPTSSTGTAPRSRS